MSEAAEIGVPFFRMGNYAPVTDELTAFDLPVEGTIPPAAQRLVPAQRSQPATTPPRTGSLGDGMIHGVRLENGRAASVPQPLGAHRKLRQRQPRCMNSDGSRESSPRHRQHPCRPARRQTLALVESSLPYEITNELETVGCLRLRRQAVAPR